jgi:hypothetical protein
MVFVFLDYAVVIGGSVGGFVLVCFVGAIIFVRYVHVTIHTSP